MTKLFAFLAVAAIAAVASAQVAVTGTVIDPSGAAVPGAAVALKAKGVAIASTVTDASGRFHLDGVAAGRYDVEVSTGTAFAPLRRAVNVAAGLAPLQLQLALASVEENVEVTGDEVRPSVDTAANLDTTTVSGAELDQLPVFDNDFVGALSQFLDPASVATGGTTLVVDGVEVKSAGVPKSAVQEIAINDDPYSAESSRPGRGRIEIITKPGSGSLRGTLGFTFRNDALAARSYFAPVKPPEQRQAVEGLVSGAPGKDSSFMLTFSRQSDDAAAVVHALTPSGPFDRSVAAPSTRSELMARISHAWSDRQRASLQVNWQRDTRAMQGVGGVVLPEAGLNSAARENDLFFTLYSTLTPQRLNQFQLIVELNREPTNSVSDARAIIVRDAFVGGGAQGTILRTESGGKLNDIVTISRGRHVIKFGVQIPNLNRRVWDDRTNRGGTFSFATLADYAAGHPYAWTVQQGSGRASLWWREYGGFVQDQVRLGPNLQASVGLRYDWQSFFHDANNVSPRASLAWSPRKDGKTVVRGGAGVFYDRSGVGPVAAVMLHDGQTLRSYTLLDPPYPDPLAGGATLDGIPINLTVLAPDVQIPYSIQYSLGLERQVTKGAAIVIGYRAARGMHLFRSVDVNAPLAPDFSTVPDPRHGHVQQIRSDGRLRSDALEMTLRGRAGKRLRGQLQYTLSNARNDTGGIFWFPADQYAPSRAEWGAADFDVRHRLNALATLDAGRWGNLGVSAKLSSGLPYSETIGADLFHTGLANARPDGIRRNTLRASGAKAFDVRWSRDLQLSKARALTLSVDAFNVFNHPNFSGYVGNIRSPFFRSPTSVAPGRRLQVGAEMKFGG
jgi:hypothetical protein